MLSQFVLRISNYAGALVCVSTDGVSWSPSTTAKIENSVALIHYLDEEAVNFQLAPP